MKIGRESAYAIEGLLALASKPMGTVMLLRDVAAARDVPRTFLAKIFQKLTRSEILLSSRGAVRGYALSRPTEEITLKDVLLATEGPDFFDRCILWSDRCAGAAPCALHSRWASVKQRIMDDLMEHTTLADLARGEGNETRRGLRRDP